jgi:hypothetical protein
MREEFMTPPPKGRDVAYSSSLANSNRSGAEIRDVARQNVLVVSASFAQTRPGNEPGSISGLHDCSRKDFPPLLEHGWWRSLNL